MNLQDILSKFSRFTPPVIPELRYIESATQRVHERWPDISVRPNSHDREKLAKRLREQVRQWRQDRRWEKANARISFVIAAAHAVFDEKRRSEADFQEARSFLLEQVAIHRSETFLSGMMVVYLGSFVKNSEHSRELAAALKKAKERMSSSGRRLLDEIPEILDAINGPRQLAVRMSKMTDPFRELERYGLQNPHGPGFMDCVHEILSAKVSPRLTSQKQIDWFLNWLRPKGRQTRESGAAIAIAALIHPWLNRNPSDEIRSHLIESLIEMYGDPRIEKGGVWTGVSTEYMRIIHRWLTREDMRFFTGVVDEAQKDAMWPPRRDFWLELYDRDMIDAAWVAFSASARRYAIKHLMREDARNAKSRFGYQSERGQRENTSLLIMHIGNKVFVEGCHNYKTHVFDKEDPEAPKLFEKKYNCERIRRISPASKPHNSISSWSRWVRDMINADVRWVR